MTLDETAQRLSAIVDRTVPVLRAIGEEEVKLERAGGGWSRKQILGHLIDSASNNHQRFVRAALQGRLEWPGYDQNGCVQVEAFQEAPWTLLLDAWSATNRLLAHILSHLPPAAANVPCRIGDEPDLSLAALATSYLTHLEHHLEQIGAFDRLPR